MAQRRIKQIISQLSEAYRLATASDKASRQELYKHLELFVHEATAASMPPVVTEAISSSAELVLITLDHDDDMAEKALHTVGLAIKTLQAYMLQKQTKRGVVPKKKRSAKFYRKVPDGIRGDMTGSLHSFSVVDLVQFIYGTKDTGMMCFMHDPKHEMGRAYFVDGEIVHATTYPKKGKEALTEIFSFRQGFFAFKKGIKTKAKRSIVESTMTLLLDSTKTFDEGTPDESDHAI